MEVTGVVKDGKIVLPDSIKLPEGTEVRIDLDRAVAKVLEPLERDPLSREEILHDLAWAHTDPFKK